MNRPSDNDPLRAEQRERGKWREGETFLEEQDAPGHTLPESERDRATDRGGGGTGGITPQAVRKLPSAEAHTATYLVD